MKHIQRATLVLAVALLAAPFATASAATGKAADFLRSAQYDLVAGTQAGIDPTNDPGGAIRLLDHQGAFREAKDPVTGAWTETADTYVAAAAVQTLEALGGDANNKAAVKGGDYLVAEQYNEKDHAFGGLPAAPVLPSLPAPLPPLPGAPALPSPPPGVPVVNPSTEYGGIRLHAPANVLDHSGDAVGTANTALGILALHSLASQSAPATLPAPFLHQLLGLPQDYSDAAAKAGDYLLRVQNADGSFPASYDPATATFSGPATARNAALAIDALLALRAQTGDARYLDGATHAARWLAGLQVIGVQHDGGFRSTGDPARADYKTEYVYETGIALDAFTKLQPQAPGALNYALAFQKGFSFLNQQKTGFGAGSVELAGYDLAANRFITQVTSSGTAWTLIFYADYQGATGLTVSQLPTTLAGEQSLQNADGSFARIEPDGSSPLEYVEDTALGAQALLAAGA